MLSCGKAMIWLSGMPAQLLIASFFPIAAAINGTKQKALVEVLETFCLRMYVWNCPESFKVTVLMRLRAKFSIILPR